MVHSRYVGSGTGEKKSYYDSCVSKRLPMYPSHYSVPVVVSGFSP
jgi:hypothetical protein